VPGEATRRFRLHGSDYFSTLLMPPLAALVGADAPGVVLHLIDRPGPPEAQLADPGADLAFDIARPVPDWLLRETLFRSHLVGVAARGHPDLASVAPGTAVPAEILVRLRHGIVAGDGAIRGTLDAGLEARGLSRRVVLILPHFHAMALAAADGGLFVALPRHFAAAVAPRLGLALYRLPVPEPSVEVAMYWHARLAEDPASHWLRAKVREACAGLAADPVNER